MAKLTQLIGEKNEDKNKWGSFCASIESVQVRRLEESPLTAVWSVKYIEKEIDKWWVDVT